MCKILQHYGQKMKVIKIILLTTTVVFLASIPLEVKADHDHKYSEIECSKAVKLHERLICKMRGEDTPQKAKKEAKEPKKKKKKMKEKTTEAKKKIEGDFKSLWKKLKNLGGKNIGEEG